MNFSFGFWPPCGSHFGGVLVAQMEAKAIKKPLQKTQKIWCPTWAQTGPKGVPIWSKNRQQWGIGSPLFQGWLPSGLRSPSRIDFGEVLGPCWDHFRQFFWLVAQLWKANILLRIAPDCVQVITAIKALMAATFGFTKRPLWLHFICKKKSKTFCKGSFLQESLAAIKALMAVTTSTQSRTNPRLAQVVQDTP